MLWLAVLAVAADRLTKYWSLSLDGATPFIPGVLRFQPLRNFGAAFGIFSGNSTFLNALVIALCVAVLLAILFYPRMTRLGSAGLWLVLAGGVSNLYDRLRFGYVIDFLEFEFMRFPVFNLADVCVVVGCALTFIALLRSEGGRARG